MRASQTTSRSDLASSASTPTLSGSPEPEDRAATISAVILTRSQPEILPACVASCARELKDGHFAGEIILVDNASTDGTPQRVARQFPEVRVIRNEENQSFSAGNNQGIRASCGGSVLILNDDAILGDGSLRLMFDTLSSNPAIGAVGPQLLNPDGSPQRGYSHRRFPRFRSLACGLLGLNSWLEKRSWTRNLLTHSFDPERSGESEHLAAACLLARRSALEAVGLFDESYFYWMEDVDLCYRLRQQGWKTVYVAEARVTHHGSASLTALLGAERRMISIRGLICYYKQHKSPLAHLLLKLIVGCVLTVYGLLDLLAAMRRRGPRFREIAQTVRASFRDLRAALWG